MPGDGEPGVGGPAGPRAAARASSSSATVAHQRATCRSPRPDCRSPKSWPVPRGQQVGLGQREAVVGAGEDAQPLQAAVVPVGQAGSRAELVGSPADPAAQLMQLRQPEPAGAQDDHDRGVGHVHPHLDDRGAHQDVGLPAA